MPAKKSANDNYPDMAPVIGRNLIDLRVNRYGARDVRKRQYEIADKVGLSGSQYQKYEQGKSGYNLAMLENIAAFFGVHFTWLFTDHEMNAAGFQEDAAAFGAGDKQEVTLQIIRLFKQIQKQSDRNELLEVLKDLKA